MDSKTYEGIKRTFNITRKTLNVGYIMNEFSLGFFEATDYIKQLVDEGVIRPVEGGYEKIPPNERPSIKKVDAILEKLDAETAEYCRILTEDQELRSCTDFLKATQEHLFYFESRMERAGLLLHRESNTDKPQFTLDEDEFNYFRKKIGRRAQELRLKEDFDRTILMPRPMNRWPFHTEAAENMFEKQKREREQKLYTNSVYNRIRESLIHKIRISAKNGEWTYDIEYAGNRRTYSMRLKRNLINTGGVVYVKNDDVYDRIKCMPLGAERVKLDKLLAQYKAAVVNGDNGIKSLGCEFGCKDDELDVICRLGSCLDTLHAFKEVLL